MTSPEKTLQALGLPVRIFTTGGGIPPSEREEFEKTIGVLQAKIDGLDAEALVLKEEEQEVKARKRKLRARRDELVAATAYLYGQRPKQPGDVVAGPGGN